MESKVSGYYQRLAILGGGFGKLFIFQYSISAYECLKCEVHRPEIKETAFAQFLGTKFDPPWKNKTQNIWFSCCRPKTSSENRPPEAIPEQPPLIWWRCNKTSTAHKPPNIRNRQQRPNTPGRMCNKTVSKTNLSCAVTRQPAGNCWGWRGDFKWGRARGLRWVYWWLLGNSPCSSWQGFLKIFFFKIRL